MGRHPVPADPVPRDPDTRRCRVVRRSPIIEGWRRIIGRRRDVNRRRRDDDRRQRNPDRPATMPPRTRRLRRRRDTNRRQPQHPASCHDPPQPNATVCYEPHSTLHPALMFRRIVLAQRIGTPRIDTTPIVPPASPAHIAWDFVRNARASLPGKIPGENSTAPDHTARNACRAG